jgi:hypothetical protein
MFWTWFYLAVLFMLALMWLPDMFAPLKARALLWFRAEIRGVVFSEFGPDLGMPTEDPKPPNKRIDDLENALLQIRTLCHCADSEKTFSFENIYIISVAALEGRETVGGA